MNSFPPPCRPSRPGRVVLLAAVLLAAMASPTHTRAKAADSAATKPEPRMGVRSKDRSVARLWIARTLSSKADAYYNYLAQNAARPLRGAEGNLGVQVLRRDIQDTTEFTMISYWTSADAMHRIEATVALQPLPRDAEFQLPPGARVQSHSVWLNDIGKMASQPKK